MLVEVYRLEKINLRCYLFHSKINPTHWLGGRMPDSMYICQRNFLKCYKLLLVSAPEIMWNVRIGAWRDRVGKDVKLFRSVKVKITRCYGFC